ncbi:YkoF family thiamine/hydroxymethylpyrimidine-binding protein [Bacillaceae bacterium S4-13-58]
MNENVACGTSQITGARFSIHPMTDKFVEVILGAIEKANTSKVWMETDDVSTLVRGRSSHVFDVVKAIFIYASQNEMHTALNATFSHGCPGDTTGEVFLAEDDKKMNEARLAPLTQYVTSQFALYPMGAASYMNTIMEQVELASSDKVTVQGVHYATQLKGNVHDIFTVLEKSFLDCQKGDSTHIVMTVNMSANSPSHKEDK